MPSTPAMTTGMIDFITRSGFITPMDDTPTPDLAVPYAAPRSACRGGARGDTGWQGLVGGIRGRPVQRSSRVAQAGHVTAPCRSLASNLPVRCTPIRTRCLRLARHAFRGAARRTSEDERDRCTHEAEEGRARWAKLVRHYSREGPRAEGKKSGESLTTLAVVLCEKGQLHVETTHDGTKQASKQV